MKKNIENPQIKAGKTSQHLSEEEKKAKSVNILVNNIEIFLKMRKIKINKLVANDMKILLKMKNKS